MGIAVLGPVAIDSGAATLGRRDRVVLATLAMRAGRVVTADQLADAIWHDAPPASAAKVVQGCVVRLRKRLGQEAIETVAGGYRLAIPSDEVDLHRFESTVGRARELLALDEPERAAYLLREALDLWRGPPLADLEDWDAGRAEAARLDELRKDAEELRLEALLRAGHYEPVLTQARALVGDAPLRERRWALLALAQYQAGRQSEALRTLNQVRTVLVQELGLDPGPDLVALEHAILNQDPALVAESTQPPSNVCPYQGLVPFDIDDAELFFGREAQVEECLERLRRVGLLVVVGPSGCGKSSLVRAGLAARLRRGGERVAVLTPGRDPLAALLGVPVSGRNVTVVVDQLEELFTLPVPEEDRLRFVEALVEHTRTGRLVLALRADRLGDVSAHPELAGLVERSMHVLVAMDDAALRRAIEGPASQAGLLIEPGLVDLLVGEVEDEPGALPLLSHALRETWVRREGRTLTVEGYRATGGIRGAVAQSAEQVYADIHPDQETALRALMLRLVVQGAEGEPVRMRVPRRQVVLPGHEDLVERLVAARLLTSDEDLVQVAHEALVRGWPRLREWLDEDVEGQRILHHLTAAAEAWDALGRPASELYRGVRLAQARAWRDRAVATLTDTEAAFLDASVRLSETRAREAARVNRRLRGLLAAATVLLLVAGAATFYAVRQTGVANNVAENAERAALFADAQRVGSRAQVTDDIALSLLLAAAGVRLDAAPQTQASLLSVASKFPLLAFSASAGGDYVDPMELSPDGRWLAASDDRNRLHLYDARTGALVDTYVHEPIPDSQSGVLPAFSPDGEILAAGTYTATEQPLRLLDPATMQELGVDLSASGLESSVVNSVQFSAGGRWLVVSLQEATPPEDLPSETPAYVAIWDMRHPARPPNRFRVGSGIQGTGVAPDGRTVYTAWPATAWDVRTGEPLWRRKAVSSYFALDLDPSGRYLGAYLHDGARNNVVVVLDADTGRTVHELRGHADQPRDVRFSNDGRLLATYSHDGQVIVWDVEDGEIIHRWNTEEVGWSVDFSADDRFVYTGGSDGMLRAWDLSAQQTLVTRSAVVEGSFAYADVSPDGRRVAYRQEGDGVGQVRFVDAGTGEVTPPSPLPVWPGPWSQGMWTADGDEYATHVGCPGPSLCDSVAGVTVLEPRTGEITAEKAVAAADELWSGAYVDSGDAMLVGDSDDRTWILDAGSLETIRGPFDVASHCCATPIGDGRTVVLYEDSDDGASEHWRVVDVRTGTILRQGDLQLRAYGSAASPDGTRVAVAGDTGEVVTIDLQTGRQVRASAGTGAEVLRVAWSADGERLVTGAVDGGVSLWDGPTLEPLGTVYPPQRGEPLPATAAFVDGSHDVTIALHDGQVFHWATDPRRMVRQVCRMAGRDLTREEWQEFLPSQPYRPVCPGNI